MGYVVTNFLFALLAASILAAILWWVVRFPQKIVRFPILKKIIVPRSRIPKLILRKPPLIPFILFILLVGIFVFFVSRPHIKRFVEDSNEFDKAIVIVDLSPSVESAYTLFEIKSTLEKSVKELSKSFEVLVKLSGDSKVYNMKSSRLQDIVDKVSFHKHGINIGRQLASVSSEIENVDGIFIISDRDDHSWRGVSWQALEKNKLIRRIRLGAKKVVDNLYFKSGRASFEDYIRAINVDLTLSGTHSQAVAANISISFNDEVLFSSFEQIPPNVENYRIRYTVDVPPDVQPNYLKISANFDTEDAVELDNEFYIEVENGTVPSGLISLPYGENILRDSASSLLLSMKVNGVSVDRFDFSRENIHSNIPFWVAMLSDSGRFDFQCPSFLTSKNVDKNRMVWLMPRSISNGFNNTCKCFHFLYKSKNESNFCESVDSREELSILLNSLGGRVIGGSLGDSDGGIGYRFTVESLNLDIAVFNVPLSASEGVITHAQLPLLISELVDTLGVKSYEKSGVKISRSDVFQRPEGQDKETLTVFENVPVQESRMKRLPENQLPKYFDEIGRWSEISKGGHLERDEYSVLQKLSIAFVLIGFLEAIFYIFRIFRGHVGILILGFFIYENTAKADIEVSILANSVKIEEAYKNLEAEVESRTSIEFSPSLRYITMNSIFDVNFVILNSSQIKKLSPSDLESLLVWIKRGGYLVVENAFESAVIALLDDLGMSKAGVFRPIPVDHELMRSFYLLQTLPNCGDGHWYGFEFDSRVAVLAIPFEISKMLQDNNKSKCFIEKREEITRSFVNLLMVSLTTDYKKDQIHLKEILKRIR